MFVNIDNGSISIDSGTSGATFTVASIITLVNDARISAGKKPVGTYSLHAVLPAVFPSKKMETLSDAFQK
jgi:hypothetical protein